MHLRLRYDGTSSQNELCGDPAARQRSMQAARQMRREEQTREWVLRRGSSCRQLIVVFVRG